MSSNRSTRAARGADEVPPGEVSIEDQIKDEKYGIVCMRSSMIQQNILIAILQFQALNKNWSLRYFK